MAEWPELALRLSAAQRGATAEAEAVEASEAEAEAEAEAVEAAEAGGAAAGQEAAMTPTEQARVALARARHGVSAWEKGNKPAELAALGMAPPPPPPPTAPPPPPPT